MTNNKFIYLLLVDTYMKKEDIELTTMWKHIKVIQAKLGSIIPMQSLHGICNQGKRRLKYLEYKDQNKNL